MNLATDKKLKSGTMNRKLSCMAKFDTPIENCKRPRLFL